MKASHSKINSFSFCAKKYEYRYVRDIPVPPKPELAFGIAIHAALEHNFRQKLDTREDLPLGEVLQHFEEALDNGLKGAQEDALRGATEFHYMRGMGHQLLGRFMEVRSPALQPAPRGVECFFRLPLPGGHEITGKFDLLDNDWVLHDFKTSSRPYNRRQADITQLVIYAWACERVFGRLPKALCFDVFVKGDGGDGDVRLQEPVFFEVPGASQMRQVAGNLEKQIQTILDTQDSGQFPRAFMPLRCKWCEYQNLCVNEWEADGRPAPVRLQLENLVG